MKTFASSLVYHARVAAAIAGFVFCSAVFGIAQSVDIGDHKVTDIKFNPQGPAILVHDQYVRLRFSYSTTHPDGVRIWARPMTAGWNTLFSATSGSPILTAREGEHEQFFTITHGDVTVDQVRIEIYTANRNTLLYQTFIPVKYQFEAKPKPRPTRQELEARRADAAQRAAQANGMPKEKLRDLPFPSGVDLQFIIKELARDMDINVLFDRESRLEGRKVNIDLRNVTATDALTYILVQEGLVSEDVGPKTIMVASKYRVASAMRIGIGITPLTDQLADHFGVKGGVLINNVRSNSPASKAGLKAGDVIVGIDDALIKGPLDLLRSIEDKGASAFVLKIVRDRKEQTVTVTSNEPSQ